MVSNLQAAWIFDPDSVRLRQSDLDLELYRMTTSALNEYAVMASRLRARFAEKALKIAQEDDQLPSNIKLELNRRYLPKQRPQHEL